jgi:hypothetical protein
LALAQPVRFTSLHERCHDLVSQLGLRRQRLPKKTACCLSLA